jgi:hypothetical protein
MVLTDGLKFASQGLYHLNTTTFFASGHFQIGSQNFALANLGPLSSHLPSPKAGINLACFVEMDSH